MTRDAHENPSIGQQSGQPSLSPAWRILAVLCATTLGFGGSMAYSQHIASRLDSDALSIATNASPAIQHLTAARSEILRIELAAAWAIQRASEGTLLDRTPLDDSLARLRRELSLYLTFPFYPHEHDRYGEVDRAARDLEAQVSDLSAHLSANEATAAISILRGKLQPAASRLDEAIEDLVVFNAEQQQRLGMEIPKLRARAVHIGFLLEAVTAALGLALMWLVWRAIRGYTRIIVEEKRLTAEHGQKVAAFGQRLELLIVSAVKITEAIATASELHAVLQVIVDESRSVVNAEYGALGRGTDPERSFDPWIFSGMSAAEANSLERPPRPVGVLGAVVRDGQLIRLEELASHSEFRGLPAGHPPIGPFLGISIVRGDQNVGSLYLARKEGQPAFDDDDERAAKLFAAYVGVAIANARLYNQAVEATHAREDLLAIVSHDLKSPLNAIRLSTEMLRRTAGGDRAEAFAVRIDRAAEHMLRLIADLLDASKIEAGALRAERRPEEVASLMNSVVDMFGPAAKGKEVRLRCALPCRSLAVFCERDLIVRVFSNLIGNAIKFSPGGASILVAAEELPGMVHFSVADAGPGIPAEHLPHAFERYWQQKGGDRRGSGLGLHIAKGIVDAHGGTIWITSTSGHGTTVHFTLPLATGNEDSASSPA